MYWKFIRESPTQRGRLAPLLWKLADAADEPTIAFVLNLLRETREKEHRVLIALIDACVRLPRTEHKRWMDFVRSVHDKVNILDAIEVAPMLLFRFDREQLSTFVEYCVSYPSEELRFRALQLSHRQAQRFAAEQTGENLFLSLKPSLTLYAQAHCNRTVSIEAAKVPYTDGIRVHLPAVIHDPNAEERYKVQTALNVGYIEFGTLDIDLRLVDGQWEHARAEELEIERMFRSFGNHVLAKDLFFLFEDHRIRRCVQREYPGIAQVISRYATPPEEIQSAQTPVDTLMVSLRNWVHHDLEPRNYRDALLGLSFDSLNGGDVHESVRLMQKIYPYAEQLLEKSSSYRPKESSDASLDTKKMRQKDREHRYLWERKKHQDDVHEEFDFQEASEFMDRMPAPAGPHQEKQNHTLHPMLTEDSEPLEGKWCYPEWDMDLQDEKPNFTMVMELRPSSNGSDFVQQTKYSYRREIVQIRRMFSALRPQENRLERHLDSGVLLDMDVVISSRIERRLGPVDVRPYKAYRKKQRSVSVAFLVDLSSSTNELVGAEGKRIVDIQKEALVLISEALDAMGDYFSIYGFSGYGREQVAVYPVKEEREVWGPDVQQRLGNLSWKMENRDGAAIRHVTEILTRGEGATKILLILSDGRPLDCGCSLYHDAYAQSDTRAALMETKKKGIRPFCITVDSGGAEYLSSMYGTSFAVIKQVEDVPVQLPKLYHRLIQ